MSAFSSARPRPRPSRASATSRSRRSSVSRLLCDPGSLQLIRTEVLSPAMGEKARDGDGVLGGSGTVDGRPVFCYAQDLELRRRLARRAARRHDRARAGAGRPRPRTGGRLRRPPAARACRRASPRSAATAGSSGGSSQLSGRVPQISIITGLSAGGGAYSPALTDWVVMTEESSMFLTGPGVVREALGEDVDRRASSAARASTSATASATSSRRRRPRRRRAGPRAARLPAQPPRRRPRRARGRRPPSGARPRTLVPAEQRTRLRRARRDRRRSSTAASCSRSRPGWARNLVTGFARIDGRTVGVIANQPRYLGGVLDAASSQKGARFVSKCDAFGIPLLVLVDTPGVHAGHAPGVRRRDPLRRRLSCTPSPRRRCRA